MGISRTAQIFRVPILSEKWVKLQILNFVRTLIGSVRTKAPEKFGNSSRGHSQESRKFSGHPYGAHCAVIFAIAQLSC